MRNLFYFLFFIIATTSWSQEDEIVMEGRQPEMKVDRHFDLHYRQALNRIRRVYPLALSAKMYIDEIEAELIEIDKKRLRKKFTKNAHDQLKDQFMWDIKDLYISEGIMLMKLIHRETGLTVAEIAEKYKGKFSAAMYAGMARIWNQDINAVYDPYGEDWITEIVISDIVNKKIEFKFEATPLDKSGYKDNMKQYRTRIKEYRKESRKEKRQSKKTAAKSKN